MNKLQKKNEKKEKKAKKKQKHYTKEKFFTKPEREIFAFLVITFEPNKI